jgi:hypothetical protein
MRLLFRIAFWLGVVIVLLPGPMLPPGPSGPQTGGTQLSARTSSADAREICPRRFEACTEPLQALAKLGHEFYRRLAEGGTRPGDKLVRRNSSDTLTAADLMAPWRGHRAQAPAAPSSTALR